MDHQDRRWTFLTSHARVLRTIAADPDARLRTIAAVCHLTERVVQAVIADLEQAGYLHRQRIGRRNQYTLDLDQPLRHPAEAHLTLRSLIDLSANHEAASAAQRRRAESSWQRPE
ncbi:ArsR family transcriptional regulator [Streptomyces sp. NPDC058642]|uniref:ArsR family transcriptional regulator n=1 Tax=Streptomyces sp. NPDC058642 TaxID=3346572 RepID=UPI0036485111